MLYTDWVWNVLNAMQNGETVRTRVVGFPAAALRESLSLDLSDVDAIEDALDDLEALGLARHRPADVFNLTPLGRQAAATSIQEVCGTTIRETCEALSDDERSFLRALAALSQSESSRFTRARYVDVDHVFDQIQVQGTHEQQESFLLPLVEKACIDYREFSGGRDVRPLYTGLVCASAAGSPAQPAAEGPATASPI